MPELESFLTGLRLRVDALAKDEAAAKQGIILPVLSSLGWDVFNTAEVVPEYKVGDARVDFCLRLGSRSVVFVEAKGLLENLDGHEEQLLKYAYREAAQIALLTNGVSWWFYLPTLEVPWPERKFFAVDIKVLEPKTAAEHFRAFLHKEALGSGQAVAHAREVHASREKQRVIRDALPKAWADALREPDRQLVEVLQRRVEGMCGHRPEESEAVNFFRQLEARTPSASEPVTYRRSQLPPLPQAGRQSRRDETGKLRTKPTSYSLRGRKIEVRSWKELLVSLCGVLYQEDRRRFESLLSRRGRIRPEFSRDKSEIISPYLVPGSDIYVETNLSANDIVRRCHELMEAFGYSRRDFRFETVPVASRKP